ncbi:acetyl-CoA acetyltransferase [Henriciella aquimarina]|uniref:acetyl-CoA acetyltransferase n=1 Tax=Henriciella aquimarina TaxID=545261 RepID=UPI001F1E129C|nr:acetyl-CoA acetyltransferase [Henriciella aquimarina]
MAKGAMPVLLGVGQSMSQWDGRDGAEGAPSPLSLARDAATAALEDAGVAAGEIDTLSFVRIFEDSVPGAPHPHGHNTNLPGTLARDLGASPKRLIYSDVGGQSPQALANEMAARIHAGEAEVALLAGSEANRASKGARKNGVEIDWADGSELAYEDRGLGPQMLSRPEIKHGLIAPAFFYAMFENAIAARQGRTRSAHREAMSKLFHPFTRVAADNPYAQFPVERSVDFLSTPSPENYEFADPFLKWHIAQDAVNQGAAVLIMSEKKADALGVAKDKRVYLHGGGEAGDDLLSERPMIDGSWAMETAIKRALDQAGKTSGGLAHFDLYSCFPCAVFSATQALGIDPFTDERALTLTGGLPFFGGPGNNYSMHGLASMAETLRTDPGSYGLVLANGGWMTKEAVGVWSTTRPERFTPAEKAAKPTETVPLEEAPSEGTVETYTVVHGRKGPQHGVIFARTAEGKRFIATAAPEALDRLREDTTPVGLKVTVETKDQVNTFRFA